MQHDEANASGCTSLDARRWRDQAQQYLITHRADAVIETTMRGDADVVEPAVRFGDAGYHVEAVILAVPEASSRLGILQRFDQQRREQGSGRLTLTSTHDAAYRGILHAGDRIDAERLVGVL